MDVCNDVCDQMFMTSATFVCHPCIMGKNNLIFSFSSFPQLEHSSMTCSRVVMRLQPTM